MAARSVLILIAALAGLLTAPRADAQLAVVDFGAITQLVSQLRTIEQELATARAQLNAAEAAYASTTGARGMEALLANVDRNYLPSSWPALQGLLNNAEAGPLAGAVTATSASNAVLSDQQLAGLSPDLRLQIAAARSLAALAQTLSRQALANNSARFGGLQGLIDAIPSARDQKGALDLQARISVENAMLQNEQTKLETLDRLMSAELRAADEQMRERIIAGHGAFASRFQPSP
jgi:type IV secretion system protein VirB5